MRSHGTRSREIRFVSRDLTGLARTWRYPPKTFCSVYIRAAPLIIKKCDLDSNTHVIFFLNDNDSSMSRLFTWQVSVEREKQVCNCPCVNAVIHWYGRLQNTHCSSSTDAYDVETGVKDIKICILLLLVQKEQHKQSFQPHIIISVLQTFK